MKNQFILLLVLGSLLLSLVLAQKDSSEEEERDAHEPTLVTVRVSPVESTTGYHQSRSFTGVIEAARSTELSFLRAGRVRSILVHEGSTVHKGQLLATLDTRSLQAERLQRQAQLDRSRARYQELRMGSRQEPKLRAQAEVRRQLSEVQLAQTKLERREQLYHQGAIASESLDEWKATVLTAQENLEVAKQNSRELLNGTRPEVKRQALADIRSAEASLQALSVLFQDSELRAPFSGKIALRTKDEGAVLGAGVPLLTLDEGGLREALFDLPADAKVPETVPIQIDGEMVLGQLVAPPVRQDLRSDTHRVRYTVPKGLPGSSALLELDEYIPEIGYWIPLESLRVAENGLWECYSLGADQTVLAQKVLVLHRKKDRVLVRGTLGEKSLVIVAGGTSVVPGQKVAVVRQ